VMSGLPFLIPILAVIGLIILVPGIVTFLPGLIR